MVHFLLFFVTLNIPSAWAVRSDFRDVPGIKFPNSAAEGATPVSVTAIAPAGDSTLPGFSELVPFALRSPDQQEAGSCLYMSLTGMAEWWLARLHPEMSRAPEGPIDLSERYLMNIAGIEEDSNGVNNWKTDSIFLFNSSHGALLNRDYRFTKGWYLRDSRGNVRQSRQGVPGAEYDTNFNWIDLRSSVTRPELLPLPRFEREVIFADPESNPWNTGIMPGDIVDRIKDLLVRNRAPVQVIYNHYGYWHSNFILGFDDEGDNKDCRFVRRFFDYMEKKASDARAQAATAKDPKERDRLLKLAAKYDRAVQGARRSWDNGGGCHKGVFYVRDSIYGDPEGPQYDYDLAKKGDEQPYGKKIVLLEYDWVRTMANHALQINAAQ